MKRETRSSEDSRAAANVRSTNHGTGHAGKATAKTVVRLSVSRAVELSGSEGLSVPSLKAASPQEELLPGVEWLGKAMEIMPLGQNAVDEVKAEGSAPAGQSHESRVRAAEDSSNGNKERHPSIGHSHRVGGEVRGTAQGGASLSESCGG
eukprot:34405-Pleurochrysis_carterae.AAC.4